MTERILRTRLIMDIGDTVAKGNEAAGSYDKVARAATKAGTDSAAGGAKAAGGARQVAGAWGSAASESEKSAGLLGNVTKKAGETVAAGVSWAARAAVSGAVAAMTIGMVTAGAQFETNMAMLQATTQSSSSTMAKASATAKQLGSDITIPATSAADAAEAMLELSKGNMTATQSMEAARGTLTLAAAAQISGADAARIQSAALNTFGLSADHAAQVADVLAAVSIASTGEMTDFATGMAQAGLAAHGMGIGLEDTATTLGIFANAGLSGSDAGTSMRTMLIAMESPSKEAAKAMKELGLQIYDAQGNFVGMRALTDQLAQAQSRMTVEQFNMAVSSAFGNDALRAGIALAGQGVTGWDKMSEAVHRHGAAQDLATAATSGLSGAWEGLMNTVSDLALTIYQFAVPAMEAIVGAFTTIIGFGADVVGFFLNLPGPVQAFSLALAGVVLLGGPLKGLWTAMTSGLSAIGPMWAATKTEVVLAGGAMAAGANLAKGAWLGLKAAFVSNPIGIAILGITTALSVFMSTTGDAAGSTADFTAAIDENTGALKDNAAATIQKSLADDGIGEVLKGSGISMETFTDAVMGNVDAIAEIEGAYNRAKGAYQGIADSNVAVALSGDDVAIGMQNQATGASEAGANLNILQGVMDSLGISTTGLGSAQQTVIDGIRDTGDASERTGRTVDEYGISVDNAGAASTDAGGPISDAAAAMQAVSDSAKAAAEDVDWLKLRMDVLAGGTISQEQAQNAMNAALRGIGSSARDVADAYDNYAQKQADLTKLQDEGTHSAGEIDAAYRDVQDASDAVRAAEEGQFDAALKVQEAAMTGATAAYENAKANGDLAGGAAAAEYAMAKAKEEFIKNSSQADIASGKAQTLADKLFGLPGTTSMELLAKDNASASIWDVYQKLKQIDGYTASTYITNQTTNIVRNWVEPLTNVITGNREDGGVVTPMHAAGGRVVSGRGISGVQDGSGAGLTWAEAATSKEYYISMKPSQAVANRGYASQAVRDLGGSVSWGSQPGAWDVRYAGAGRNSQSAPMGAAGSMEAQMERLISAVLRGGGGVRKLADRIEINTQDPDVTGALNRVVARMPR